MKQRIATAALVGAITFLCTFIELTFIYTHWRHHIAMLHVAALLYATLLGAINAAATFAVSFALTNP